MDTVMAANGRSGEPLHTLKRLRTETEIDCGEYDGRSGSHIHVQVLMLKQTRGFHTAAITAFWRSLGSLGAPWELCAHG